MEIIKTKDNFKGQGKMDPFTRLTLGKQKYDTKVSMNAGKFPKWNETFNFVYDAQNAEIQLEVFDKDTRKGQANLFGNGTLRLKEIEQQSDWEFKLPIVNKYKKDLGTVTVICDFFGKKPPPKKQKPEQQQQQQEPEPMRQSQPQKKFKVLPPLERPQIDFQSCQYDEQINDLEARIKGEEQRLQDNQDSAFIYLQKTVQAAILEGLLHLKKKKFTFN